MEGGLDAVEVVLTDGREQGDGLVHVRGHLIESDALQNVLFKIYRGEFDKLKPSGKKSSTGSQESEADGNAAGDSEADAEGGGAEEAHGEEDR